MARSRGGQILNNAFMRNALMAIFREKNGHPNGIRTRVTPVKGECPRPLDDRVKEGGVFSRSGYCSSCISRTNDSPFLDSLRRCVKMG